MTYALMSSLASLALSSVTLANPALVVEQSSQWGGGYTASLTIENPAGSPVIDGWSIQWSDGPAIESLWGGGSPEPYSSTTVAAVQHFLHEAGDCSAWQHAEVISRVKPFSREMSPGMAEWFLRQGETDLAQYVLVDFVGSPGSGELASALWSQFGFDVVHGITVLSLP